MMRVSREQLAERWALTYSQDGYDVRAEHVPGRRYPRPTAGVVPDLEALKGDERRSSTKLVAATRGCTWL
jgi:hypothetical protein